MATLGHSIIEPKAKDAVFLALVKCITFVLLLMKLSKNCMLLYWLDKAKLSLGCNFDIDNGHIVMLLCGL